MYWGRGSLRRMLTSLSQKGRYCIFLKRSAGGGEDCGGCRRSFESPLHCLLSGGRPHWGGSLGKGAKRKCSGKSQVFRTKKHKKSLWEGRFFRLGGKNESKGSCSVVGIWGVREKSDHSLKEREGKKREKSKRYGRSWNELGRGWGGARLLIRKAVRKGGKYFSSRLV